MSRRLALVLRDAASLFVNGAELCDRMRSLVATRRYTRRSPHFVAWRSREVLPSYLGRARGHGRVTGHGHPTGFADVPLLRLARWSGR